MCVGGGCLRARLRGSFARLSRRPAACWNLSFRQSVADRAICG
jgi:hypothetical protein